MNFHITASLIVQAEISQGTTEKMQTVSNTIINNKKQQDK